MIQVDAATDAALRARSHKIRPRITWEQGNLSGTPENSIDISDRLVSFPGCVASMGAYLGGVQQSRESLVLQNSDGMLTPDKSGGLFGNRKAAERLMARVSVEVGVETATGAMGYVPVYAGYVQDHVLTPGQVEFDLVAPMALLQNVQVPEDVVIEPFPHSTYGHTPAELAKSLLADNSPLDSTADFDSTWDTLETTYRELDWCIGGRIRAGTSITAAADMVARSGLATIIPREDGTLALVSEFPEQFTRRHDHYGDLIDESIASDWTVVEAADVACTAVSVAYNSVSIRYPNSAHAAEADLGKLHRIVPCPYIYLARTAWLAAYILYTQNSVDNSPLAISWAMGLRGWLIQLGDRVRVKDPITETERTLRIVSKSIGSGRVFLTGVSEGHETGIIQGTFGEWGSATWGSEAML